MTLIPNPLGGWYFKFWSGDPDCSDGTITMDGSKSCTAVFTSTPPVSGTLQVNKSGSGRGTVTSSPPGIHCGADCSETYTPNTLVTLTALADSGSRFDGWTGDPDCTDGQITMNGSKSCTAVFTALASPTPTPTPTATFTPTPTPTQPPLKADLVVSGLTVSPATVAPGGSLTFSFSVRNMGQASAPLNPMLSNGLYLSRDTAISLGYVYLGDQGYGQLSPLAPGESISVTPLGPASRTVPSTTASGAWYFCVRTDDARKIDESDETNDTSCIAVTVTPQPTFTPSPTPVTSTVPPGAPDGICPQADGAVSPRNGGTIDSDGHRFVSHGVDRHNL